MKNVDNLDVMMPNLVKNNIEKIKATTPVNPSIKKNDEWRKEDSWDELYKELENRWEFGKYGLQTSLTMKICKGKSAIAFAKW